MHIPTVLAHGRGCKLVFNKDYTGQRLESLLLSGLGQSSLNRMDRDTGCCVGSSSSGQSSTTSSSHCTVTVTAEDYLWGSWPGLAGFFQQWERALDEASGTAFGDSSCS